MILAVNGFKRAGKGTVADIVEDYAGKTVRVQQVGFADKLKCLAAYTLGVVDTPERQIELMDEFKLPGGHIQVSAYSGAPYYAVGGREFLQELGTRGRQLFGDYFWVDQVLPLDFAPADALTIVTDLRFENEAQRVLDLGGVVWEIIRPEATSDGHASEQPLPPHLVSRTIINDGTLDDLRGKVEAAYEEDVMTNQVASC